MGGVAPRVRAAAAVAAVALTFPAGCGGAGGGEAAGQRPPVLDSASLEGKLRRGCAELTRTERAVVLCPSWLPADRRGPDRYDGYSLSQEDFDPDRCRYLTQMGYGGQGAGETVPFHVLFGGVCGRLPLATAGGRWPAGAGRSGSDGLYARYLRLLTEVVEPAQRRETVVRPHVVARAFVDGRRALLLRVEPYPRGGIHGGHYGIVWNEGRAGYALSFHYDRGDAGRGGGPRRPRPGDRLALVRAAERMVAVAEPAMGDPGR